MGKRTREVMMRTWKEEKDRALKERYKELEQHKYWDNTYKRSSSTLDLLSMSPRKLMYCLQTEHATLLASSEEDELSSLEVCNECLDCISSDHEKGRSVVASYANVHGNICGNEMNANATEKCCDDDIDREFSKGIGEKITACGDVKIRETIRNAVSVGRVFSVLVLVLAWIGIAIAARHILSICTTWFLPDDLNFVFLPPT